MQTTIVISDNRIDMFHSAGGLETFAGPDAVKKFMERFKKVSKALALTNNINAAVAKAEMNQKLRKFKSSLKPSKKA